MRASEPRKGRHLPSIVEMAKQPLRAQDRGALRPDAPDVEQHLRRRGRLSILRLIGERGIALNLDRLDLLEQKLQPIDLAQDLRLQMRWKIAAVSGAQVL